MSRRLTASTSPPGSSSCAAGRTQISILKEGAPVETPDCEHEHPGLVSLCGRRVANLEEGALVETPDCEHEYTGLVSLCG